MTSTVAEAQTKLARIIAQAEAGKDIFIGSEADHPAAKSVSVASLGTRLTRHPDLIGSTTTHDRVVLVEPLPTEECGDLAGRIAAQSCQPSVAPTLLQYVLDTCTYIWLVDDQTKLSAAALAAAGDVNNSLHISAEASRH